MKDNGFEVDEIDEESVHSYLKNKFLSKRIANDDGLFIDLQGTTKNITNTAMLEYLEAIIRWAATFLGIEILFPWEVLSKEDTYNI